MSATWLESPFFEGILRLLIRCRVLWAGNLSREAHPDHVEPASVLRHDDTSVFLDPLRHLAGRPEAAVGRDPSQGHRQLGALLLTQERIGAILVAPVHERDGTALVVAANRSPHPVLAPLADVGDVARAPALRLEQHGLPGISLPAAPTTPTDDGEAALGSPQTGPDRDLAADAGPADEDTDDVDTALDGSRSGPVWLETGPPSPPAPRLRHADSPIRPSPRPLDGLQATLERLDVRVSVTRLVTPIPAAPIRDLGEVFELPRPAPPEPVTEPRGETNLEAPGEPAGADQQAAGNRGDGSATGQESGGGDASAYARLPAAGETSFANTADAFSVPDSPNVLVQVADRATAASLELDARAVPTDGITVHLDDVLGRWEVDVRRRDGELSLVLRGDASLHDAVRQGAGELRDRLASDGLVLRQLEFQPLERSQADRGTVRPAQESAAGAFHPGNGERGGRREEAPPWPVPRTRRADVLAAQASAHRGALDRAV
jgi:hypothetical protein